LIREMKLGNERTAHDNQPRNQMEIRLKSTKEDLPMMVMMVMMMMMEMMEKKKNANDGDDDDVGNENKKNQQNVQAKSEQVEEATGGQMRPAPMKHA
jgi:hypothetical protein